TAPGVTPSFAAAREKLNSLPASTKLLSPLRGGSSSRIGSPCEKKSKAAAIKSFAAAAVHRHLCRHRGQRQQRKSDTMDGSSGLGRANARQHVGGDSRGQNLFRIDRSFRDLLR